MPGDLVVGGFARRFLAAGFEAPGVTTEADSGSSRLLSTGSSESNSSTSSSGRSDSVRSSSETLPEALGVVPWERGVRTGTLGVCQVLRVTRGGMSSA